MRFIFVFPRLLAQSQFQAWAMPVMGVAPPTTQLDQKVLKPAIEVRRQTKRRGRQGWTWRTWIMLINPQGGVPWSVLCADVE